MRRITVPLLAALLLAGCAAGAGTPPATAPGAAPAAAPAGDAPLLVVHYFNDLHGHLEPFSRKGQPELVGGVARLAGLLGQRRAAAAAAGADTLLLEAGDVLQGTPMSTVFLGEPDFAVLAKLGVDALAIGNHELDYGQENLLRRIEQVPFPVLAANVRRSDGSLFTGRDFVVLTTPKHRLRVAVLGLVTGDTAVTTHPKNVNGLRFEDPVETARNYLPKLVAQSDMVLVLSHCGHEVDRQLAALPGVAAVVGGHDQILLEPPPVIAGVPVVQAYEWGEYLGEARFFAGEDGKPRWRDNQYLRVVGDLPEDAEIAHLVATYRGRLAPELNRVVAQLKVRLDGDRDHARYRETNLGDLVADAMIAATGAEISLVNSGSIRGSIEAGGATLEDVMEALPYDNRIQVVELTGAEVRSMLRQSVEGPGGGGFLQVGGLRVRETKDSLDIQVAGKPLDDARRYRVATSDFLIAGGDGYDQMRGKSARDTGFMLIDAVLRWLELQPSPIEAAADGRLDLVRFAAQSAA